jgi:hypothetical protein
MKRPSDPKTRNTFFDIENSGNATQGLQTQLPDEREQGGTLRCRSQKPFSENDRDDSVRLLPSRDDST